VPTPYILAELKAAGQTAAQDFLKSHKQALNVESTINLRDTYG
jgi:NTE family protein